MKKVLVLLGLILLISSCLSRPKNFTSLFTNKFTGLDSLIRIDGYYVSQHMNDTAFYSMFMFYSNGLFTIATTSSVTQELIDCFEKGGKSKVCQYLLWGTYIISGDTIKTQVIRPEGGACVIFRDYLILKNKEILNISDYVQPQYTKMAYMSNYPSVVNYTKELNARFFDLKEKRDSTECTFIKSRWFYKE